VGNNMQFLIDYYQYIDNVDSNQLKDDLIYNEILKRTKFGRLAIVEGLIHTHPVDKSTNILKRRFPELTIEVENDGEIYIENQPPQKLVKYLPIITNLGYFISLATFDGEKWIKEYDNNSSPIAFYLEPKYDLKVTVPEILYHVSPIKFKDKISKIGFIPKTGNKKSNHPDRIYLTDDLNISIRFGENIKNETKNGYCIYKIDGKFIDNLYIDINLRDGGFYTLQNISPNSFQLIKEVK
jgi:hypothetical protein